MCENIYIQYANVCTFKILDLTYEKDNCCKRNLSLHRNSLITNKSKSNGNDW